MEPARVWAIKAVVLGRTFFVDPCPECGQAEVRIRDSSSPCPWGHGGMHQAQRAFGNSRPAAASQTHEETNP